MSETPIPPLSFGAALELLPRVASALRLYVARRYRIATSTEFYRRVTAELFRGLVQSVELNVQPLDDRPISLRFCR